MEFLQFQYYEMRKKNKENLPGKWSCCDMVNSIDYMFSVIAWMSIIIFIIIIIIIILLLLSLLLLFCNNDKKNMITEKFVL